MRSFSTGIIIRIMLIACWACIGAWSWYQNNHGIFILMVGMMLISAYNLYHFTTSLNKKLSRIFDSIQYEDFAITFRADNAKGESFEDLNASLNAVIKSFNQVRAEREATLHFIQAIIQQINVGILSYNTDGKIELINQAANKIMGIYKLSHVSAINIQQPDIYQLMTTLPSGESKLLKVSNQEISLSVKEIILRDRKIRLIALHNIRSELQNRELEAWQNLTKVLRHEIMNTVTPIVSLSQTMRDIIDTDLKDVSGHQQVEGVKDLKNAINTVINRSKGIMNFVNAYREFTNIPLPNVSELHISQVFDELKSLFENQPIDFILDSNFKIHADSDQIGQVLINLLKNAVEATENIENAKITIKAYLNQQDKIIEVVDNGSGIKPEDADKIFVPFFTTKPTGTGIGLSLSRQIIQMHGGRLEYEALRPCGSRFYIVLG
ncbi:MAG: GHKL domain-containing protein [Saprospiraceae bacterium]|jgi:two-component system nitrogen regulation sensor histidine kinase NtrY|nr:GHKL domain-containing protein [Saprospiraceae bacterium]MBP6445264.1 GHKL domain-containing protein [Saprospiraceae bacterium]